jgi:hypothetical protein
MKKQDMSIVIEEIARVAFTEIGEELDLSDEYLLEVRDYLEAQEQEEQDQEENAPAELSSADRILRTTTELPDFWAKESYNEDLL